MARPGYGWVRDLPDHRDQFLAAPMATSAVLPPRVDLRPGCPPVFDQGRLGSCTANAIAGALQFDEIKAGVAQPWTPSRLFIYYNERVIEGNVSSDSGAQIRDGIKSVNKQGVCPETEWPYDISKFAVKPPDACYRDAARDRISSYLRVPHTLIQLKSCVAAGFPFVFGFTVFESFESPAVASSGIMPMPQPSEARIGGHAVCCVGYDDADQRLIVRNSWGGGWGDAGHFHMPYAYAVDPGLTADFWTIRSAPGGTPLA